MSFPSAPTASHWYRGDSCITKLQMVSRECTVCLRRLRLRFASQGCGKRPPSVGGTLPSSSGGRATGASPSSARDPPLTRSGSSAVRHLLPAELASSPRFSCAFNFCPDFSFGQYQKFLVGVSLGGARDAVMEVWQLLLPSCFQSRFLKCETQKEQTPKAGGFLSLSPPLFVKCKHREKSQVSISPQIYGRFWIELRADTLESLQEKPLGYLVPKLLHNPGWMYAILALLHQSVWDEQKGRLISYK